MTNKDIREAYESLAPTDAQKQKMLDAILSQAHHDASVRKDVVMKKYTRRLAMVAALIAMALLLVGCAVAVMLGLQDLKMDEFVEQYPGETQVTHDVISLQGFVGSPGYLAAQEWNKFMESYDPKREIYRWAKYHHFEVPDGYGAPGCYSQEMIDKIDEICAKYNLKLHGESWDVLDVQQVFDAIGIHGIQAEGTDAEFELYNGGCYADGSFSLRGGVRFKGQRVGDMLNFECNRKDTFGASTDMISNVEDFEEWNYTTKNGVKLLLAMAGDEAFMIADREDYFIRVRIFNEVCSYIADLEVQKRTLEEMAECFDFTIQPQKVDASILEKADQDWDAMWAESDQNHARDFRRNGYKAYMYSNVSYMIDRGNQKYALIDLNGDGIEELIISFRDHIEHVLTLDGNLTSLMLDACHDSLSRDLDLCENGVLRCKAQCGSCFSYTFYQMGDDPFAVEYGRAKPIDFVEYHDEAPAHWGRSTDGDNISDQEITEAEAKKIIDSYKLLELDWKPIEEFPLD